jgi:hypothetical protein
LNFVNFKDRMYWVKGEWDDSQEEHRRNELVQEAWDTEMENVNYKKNTYTQEGSD